MKTYRICKKKQKMFLRPSWKIIANIKNGLYSVVHTPVHSYKVFIIANLYKFDALTETTVNY